MRFLFSVLVAFFISFSVNAQNTYAKYADSPKTFLGIDFTSAQFVDTKAFPISSNIPTYITQWNNFVIKEPAKYDLSKAFGDTNITTDLSQVQARNAKIDTNFIVQELAYAFNSKKAEEIALSYSFNGMEGLAILVVAECYNKPASIGTHYLVIIDVETEEVIFNKKYSAKPKGFGRRNYWARTFYSLLQEVPEDLK